MRDPLRAPGAVPVAQPKNQKRKLAKSDNGESSPQGGSSLASGLHGKFRSLIDGMISECGSETSRLTGELVELQGRWSETEAMLTAVKDSHSAKVSKLEVAIGDLERDLGKTATSRGIQEATDVLRSEFQARLAKISASLGSLECIRSRDLALATIEGWMAVVRSFQSEAPPTLEAEEARLSGCKGDMAAVDGDFDLILADLKSACFLPTCSEDPEGKDPMVGENGGDAAPGSDEATVGKEGDALSSHILLRLRNVSFEICFESSSVRCGLCGGAEDIEYKHRGMVCAVTSRLSFFLLRFLPDSYRFKVRDSAIILVSDVGESSLRDDYVCLGRSRFLRRSILWDSNRANQARSPRIHAVRSLCSNQTRAKLGRYETKHYENRTKYETTTRIYFNPTQENSKQNIYHINKPRKAARDSKPPTASPVKVPGQRSAERIRGTIHFLATIGKPGRNLLGIRGNRDGIPEPLNLLVNRRDKRLSMGTFTHPTLHQAHFLFKHIVIGSRPPKTSDRTAALAKVTHRGKGILEVPILNLKLRCTSLHHLDDFSFAFPLRFTNSPRMITSKLRLSLQHLALHASEIPLRFLRFEAVDHGFSMARLNGRAQQAQALQNRLACYKHIHRTITKKFSKN
ncbi:hypothetical protein IGI04_023465 [Brassica rapa subsp. trilocularis]|uniref:DUF641 domain-containing protein n=1 Tax=Brassica rapa subsp. trilocularis TaxID=1813537 RepID=A0ABQ7M3X9_BRACM|nr:hypothetical protein IGI04_023465 [Brassica rapa subsp. trilocularis]